MFNTHFRKLIGLGIAACAALGAQSASAAFVDFIIRGTPTINHPVVGQTEFVISAGGQKAAQGSNDVNGHTLGSLTSIKIDRLDDETRFTAGSGPAVGPYLNFWITDGAGHYAVVANEPSNPDFQSLYNNGYALSFSDLSNKVAKIYENSSLGWLPNNGIGLTFGDLAGFVIEAPSASLLAAGWAGLGSGAPRELGTNTAYGVNWVFGDTLSNYTSGDPGYLVANASVAAAAAVPEPGTMVLLGAGLLSLAAIRRRKQQA